MTVPSRPSRPPRATAGAKPAAGGGTLIFRATLPGSPSVYRDIEVEGRKSLYDLAAAIVRSFDFDFDHAFGFYSGKTRPTLMTARPKYELFTDMGEPTEGALGVERTKIAAAFPTIGHVMTFLFDYGDDWLFKIQLIGAGQKAAKQRYPRVVASKGVAPEQYPALEDGKE
jgi:hypothetical protein